MKLIKKHLVIKSNKLIGMQSDLNLTQLKVFAKVIIETVKNPKNDFYRFSIRELMKEFYITDTNYTALKNATSKMIKVVIFKGDNENDEVQLALFTKVFYSSGWVDMYLHPDLKPYILDIERKYTKYYFENIA
jgi:plasmid replication initiation protein